MNKKESRVMRSFQTRVIVAIEQNRFSAIDLKNDLFVKWLVGYLLDCRIPYQLIPMGGGVTRILKTDGLCPLCRGKGFIEGETPDLPDSVMTVREFPNPLTRLPMAPAMRSDDPHRAA